MKKKISLDIGYKWQFGLWIFRTDPIRPFISGHVANNMAAEVIALLHGLLSAPETHSAQSWSEAVQRVSKNWLLSEELSLAHIEFCGIIYIFHVNQFFMK